MTHIKKYNINSVNEIDYVSTNIIESKLCIVTNLVIKLPNLIITKQL